MHVVHGSHFWQFGSITSLATEITDGGLFQPFAPLFCCLVGLRLFCFFIVANQILKPIVAQLGMQQYWQSPRDLA